MEEKEIFDVFERSLAAWNRGDLAGYMETFASNARYISGGAVLRGKEAIHAQYVDRFASPAGMGQLSLDHLEIDFVNESIAFVFGQIRLMLAGTPRPVAFTVQLKKFDGQWLIISDHAS